MLLLSALFPSHVKLFSARVTFVSISRWTCWNVSHLSRLTVSTKETWVCGAQYLLWHCVQLGLPSQPFSLLVKPLGFSFFFLLKCEATN